MDPVILDEKAREAVHAAKNAAQAIEIVRQEQVDKATDRAAEAAAERVAERLLDDERLSKIVHKQLVNVLSVGTDNERALVLARVPYICADIRSINVNLELLKTSLSTYPVVKSLVFGFAGLILTTVVGALIALVVIK